MRSTEGAKARLRARAHAAGFAQSSTPAVGDLLSTLAASKTDGQFLELGTAIGLGTACLLDGMSSAARLTTVELTRELSTIAQPEIRDSRVDFVVADGGAWLEAQARTAARYDLIFADTWPGKYDHLDEALALVRTGGFYVVDDLASQPDWPDDHQGRCPAHPAARTGAVAGRRAHRSPRGHDLHQAQLTRTGPEVLTPANSVSSAISPGSPRRPYRRIR